MLQFHNAHKIETLVIWKLGEIILQKIKTTGCYDWEPGCIKGSKYDARWHKNCVELSNMYKSN